MILKQSDLELAQKETEKVINRVNKKISELGENTNKIYLRLCMVQELSLIHIYEFSHKSNKTFDVILVHST